MTDKLCPEDQVETFDLVFPSEEDVGDKETTEEEEGVNGEESLEHSLKGAGVVHLVDSPGRVVQVGEGEKESVAQNNPEEMKNPNCPSSAHQVMLRKRRPWRQLSSSLPDLATLKQNGSTAEDCFCIIARGGIYSEI